MKKSPHSVGHFFLSPLPKKLALAVLIASVTAAQASIIVSEGFDYSTGQLTTMTGTGTGFTGDWTGISGLANNNLTSFNVTSDSLTMTGVYSSGNKLFFQRAANNTAGLTRAFTTPLAVDQTLYGSYLFQFNSNGTTARTVGGVLTGTSSDVDNNAAFVWAGNGFNGANSAPFVEGPNVRVEGTGTPVPTFSLSINTTYLMLFDFDATTKTTNAWVLNEAQLVDVMSNGALNTTALNARTTNTNDASGVSWMSGTLTNGPATMSSMTNLSLLGLSSTQGNAYSFTYDEIRFSDTSLTEAVTVVPEPSTLALTMGIGLFALSRTIRRRRGA